jgi:ATP-binding cassette subfamily C protein
MRYSFRELFREILKDKKRLFLAQILAFFAILAAVPTPLLMPLLVDEVLLGKGGWWIERLKEFNIQTPFGFILTTLIVTLFLRFLYTFLNILQTRIFQTISKNVTAKIRVDVLNHLKEINLKEYESLGSGKVVSRLITDIATIDSFISSSISKLLVSILMLSAISVVLLFIHWKLALFILLLNPIVVLFSSKVAKKVARLKKEENRAIEIFSESLVETLELFDEIKANNKEGYFFKKLIKFVKDIKKHSIEFSWKSDAGIRISFLIFVSGFEIFRAAGILAVAYSDLSIGLMMAIFAYLWFMMTPIQDIINIGYAKKSADVALKRINELFYLKKEPKFPHLYNPFKDLLVGVEVKNIRFSYENFEVLKGVSLNIKAGKISAIVGASGSGKTTLCRLIVGYYPPQEGEILFNKKDIKYIGLDIVRDNVAMVLQNSKLFNETLLFNLTLGKKIDKKRILEAIKMAQLEEVVKKLPNGLESVVGKEGVKLSGGERQRVAIARMILKEPKVVILDESTSAIDVETEERLFKALEEFLSKRTTILIAHRASTIKNADFIFFLKDGKIQRSLSFEEYKEKFG